MATVKAYSVARTDETNTPSTVYSLQSGGGAVPSTGRNGAYDHNDQAGRVEGRTPTLVTSGQTITGATAATPFSATTTAGTALGDAAPASTSVVCTTTTITGNGAGLVVKFTTTSAGAVAAFGSITAVETGMGYADGDTVQIDGWVGNVMVVNAA